MNFFSFCRRGALTGMLLLLGITSAQAADWPRQVTDSYGTHTLPSQPLRIVSTSVTLTGSLLAIDAPVVASGATTPNNRVADSQGFLRQWSEVAKARKLARLYIGEPSAEAVAAQMPDLILVSATGNGSRKEGLTCTRRANKKHALGDSCAEGAELFGALEEVNHFA